MIKEGGRVEMRIGELTIDNYKEFLKILGVNNTESLDNLLDDLNGKESDFDHSYEARNAALVAAGHEDGMLIREGDMSFRKIVPVSDAIRKKLVDTKFKQFMENGNGMSSANDGDEIGLIMKEYRKSIPPKDRLSVTWTLSQISMDEAQRLIDKVKAHDPSWQYGQPFDKSIFDDYVPDGIDIRV